MKKDTKIIVIVVVVLTLLKAMLFTVDQAKQAIILEFGKPVKTITEPGLKIKMPFIQNVIQFENRLLVYDAAPADVITKDKKTLLVDNFSRWRIYNPLQFYQSVRNEAGAQARLDDIIYAELRVELGKHDLSDIVSKTRSEIMKRVTVRSDSIARPYGIESDRTVTLFIISERVLLTISDKS
jgi:modulator of FtsH protease HflC